MFEHYLLCRTDKLIPCGLRKRVISAYRKTLRQKGWGFVQFII
jgi:hypothetical protein